MRILLTNDDGVHAPGIHAMRTALLSLGEVFLVAPERQRSAAGHAITLHKPLRIHTSRLPDGTEIWATSGTPTDCVTLGLEIVMDGRCDLVISGINAGPNLGWDLTYSGTVAAAFEGAVLNLPAIAVSVAAENTAADAIDFAPAAEFTSRLAARLLKEPLPPHTFLNVNAPPVSADQLRGYAITHQGRREYIDRIITRTDPNGRPYYWQAGSLRDDAQDEGSDVNAILQNQISVTPVQLDLTDYSLLDRVRKWEL